MILTDEQQEEILSRWNARDYDGYQTDALNLMETLQTYKAKVADLKRQLADALKKGKT